MATDRLQDPDERSERGIVRSITVGGIRRFEYKGRPVQSAIWKDPVQGRIRARGVNLEGDDQADREAHGGPDKAVYAYAIEDLRWWEGQIGRPLAPGELGENLTVEGLDVTGALVGERWEIGSVVLEVAEPRVPCWRLGVRMGDEDFPGTFTEAGRPGAYLRIVVEGELGAGDEIRVVERPDHELSIGDVFRIFSHDHEQAAALLEVPQMSEAWQRWAEKTAARSKRRAKPQKTDPQALAWQCLRRFVLSDRVEELEDVRSFYLTPEDGEPLPPYTPGQFLTVEVRPPGTERPAIRSYSLSDTPRPERYRVTIKREGPPPDQPDATPGLVSSHLHDRVEVGDVIDVRAPAGVFTLDAAAPGTPVALVAGGIGLTPLLAILNGIVRGGSDREAWLFYGVRNRRQHLMREHLRRIAEENANVDLTVCYSEPDGAPSNDREVGSGRLSVELIKETLPAMDFEFFLCGPAAMMSALTEGLDDWGVPADRVHFEAFGPATVKRLSPSTTEPGCGIEVTFSRTGRIAEWSQADLPLLELAEENGVSIDFGCRAGNCGTCATALLSGEVSYLHDPGAPFDESECLPCICVPASAVVLDA
jgi:ferredoxin-NADP reductase/MOSC domain-containing protein YiiM